MVFIRNNSGAFINPKGQFYKMGRPGSPDLLIFLKNGRCAHIEVKNEKGKQNEAQKEYEQAVTDLGHDYHVVRSVEQVEQLLNS
ncbi:VRR-NUC domain-containing protein [Syntrophus aciditrophicus]|uniref:VRR-NUC domain-containing protein n=1 Tax=Syntrophus aciditrophicus TaxID=316277 RepID=UPI001305397F|nr:VRR-NUC domain-containing protein [Syntrophus aciditrophicus]